MNIFLRSFLALALLTGLVGLARPAGEMKLVSKAFNPNALIPKRHTCDGPDLSPPLAWSGVPHQAKSLAVMCLDPDAPGAAWLHWLAWDFLPVQASLEEGQPRTGTMMSGARQGINDFGGLGWGGPCPPPGHTHRYVFTLYALDKILNLPAGSSQIKFEAAVKNHVLAQATLIGAYRR